MRQKTASGGKRAGHWALRRWPRRSDVRELPPSPLRALSAWKPAKKGKKSAPQPVDSRNRTAYVGEAVHEM